jgi:hypothetical protein
LLIGGNDENLYYFKLDDENMLNPQKPRITKMKKIVTCIVPLHLSEEKFLIG